MHGYWVNLTGIPLHGKDYLIEDQDIWQEQIEHYKLPYKLEQAFKAFVHVQVKTQGCLVSGSFTGSITLPCSRCAEPTRFDFKHSFEVFEEFPDAHIESNRLLFLRKELGVWKLDLGGLLWEQFVLELPVKPLCSEECAGICPKCGSNLNHSTCTCVKDSRDPRMALFKKIKIG